jgi:alpha-galactosidase
MLGDLPPQLTALMGTYINLQELTVSALMTKGRDHIFNAAMMNTHTAAELDLIWSLVYDLLVAHRDWLPEWTHTPDR